MAKPYTVAALMTAVALVLIVAATVVALGLGDQLDSDSTPLVVSLIGVVVATVPALVAAAFAERAAKDIRNGTLVAKAKEGAAQAIQEQGVIVRDGPAVQLTMQSLAELLREHNAHHHKGDGSP